MQPTEETKGFLIENNICHDCNAKEGELHKLGCDMEVCPFCGGELIGCDCIYEILGFTIDDTKKFHGLPEKIYYKGVSNDMFNTWCIALNKKGRIPYIIIPTFCVRCLKPYPDMFKVSDKNWKKIPINLQYEQLCKDCYNKIINWLEEKKQ